MLGVLRSQNLRESDSLLSIAVQRGEAATAQRRFLSLGAAGQRDAAQDHRAAEGLQQTQRLGQNNPGEERRHCRLQQQAERGE